MRVEHRHSRAYRRSYTRFIALQLPLMLLVPAIVLFVTEFNGPTVHDAFRNAFSSLFSFRDGLSFWPFILAGTCCMLLYATPINRCWCDLRLGGAASKVPGALALKRLDHLGPVVIFFNILIFGLGSFLRTNNSEQAQFFLAPKAYAFGEACSVGLMLGVLQFINFGNMLMPARREILAAYPDLVPRRSSLFGKIFVIVAAVVIFMVFQVFSSAGAFFDLGARGARLPGLPGLLGKPGLQAFEGDRGLQDALAVFRWRLLGLILIVSQLVMQIKIMIGRPLEMIRGRLSKLNADTPEPGKEIQVLYNDEYAQVYREINRLIERQTGELRSSRDRLDSITSNAADPIIVYGEKGIVQAFNPAAERYFGYEAAQVRGKDIAAFISHAAYGNDCVDEAARGPEAERGPEAATGEERTLSMLSGATGFMRFQARSKSGEFLCFEAHTARSEGPNGRVYTVILRDVRHQVEIEESLRKARRRPRTRTG